MADRIGYVVVEYNQASHEPAVIGDVHRRVEDARDVLDQARRETAAVGRRESHEIAVLTTLDEET